MSDREPERVEVLRRLALLLKDDPRGEIKPPRVREGWEKADPKKVGMRRVAPWWRVRET